VPSGPGPPSGGSAEPVPAAYERKRQSALAARLAGNRRQAAQIIGLSERKDDARLRHLPGSGKRWATNAAKWPMHLSLGPNSRIPWPEQPGSPVFAAHLETGSAGRPAEQLLDTPALALGRTARAAVAGRHRGGFLAGRRGRAIVDITLDGNRCAGTLGDDPLDDHDAFASFVAQPHLITGPYGMRGLDPYPIDPDVPGPACTGRGRTGPGQPH